MNTDIAAYVALFLAVLGQSTFIVSIIAPGLSAVLAATFLATTGQLNLIVIFAVAWTASLLGDNIGYVIGRYGVERISPVERWFNKAKPRAAKFFRQHQILPLFYPFLGFTRTPLPIFLGSIEYKVGKWFALCLAATTLFYSVFISGCYLLGKVIGRDSAENVIIVVQAVVAAALLVTLMRFLVRRRRQKRTA